MTRRPHRATGHPRTGRNAASIGWRIRLWLHHHGLLDAMRLPPAGPKTEAAFRAAIAAGTAPPRFLRSTTRGRPRKSSHSMEVAQHV